MRVLFLTSQLPFPPYSGGPLRSYGLISGLHAAGHSVDLLTFTEPGQPDPAGTPLAERCAHIWAVPAPRRSLRDRLRDLLLSAEADMARRFYAPGYAEALTGVLRGQTYDIIQIESLEMTPYLLVARTLCPAARIIYDALNAEHDLQRLIHRIDRRTPARWPAALYSFIQWRRLIRMEREICRAVDQVIAVSDEDARALRDLAPAARIAVVPNGIYADEYAETHERLDLGPAALLFTGTMNYRPNVDAVLWFVDSVLEVVREAVPEAKLFIVGNKPHPRLEAIRRRNDVEITGFVQDVTPFLHSTALYVAPLRMGSGTRLKLLQAMAAGAAIVSTRIGAEGLNITSGQEVVLADDATAFAQATVALLRDPDRRTALGRAAQALVRQQYDWSVIMPRLLTVYRELCGG